MNALTLPERAAVALGTAEHEIKLIALAKESADIVAVTNVAGRDQAHRIGMNLRTTRTTIQKIGKDARDDATKFSKAIIAEEDRLICIIQPEEVRVIGLRDGFDAEEKARKDAKIAAERARIENIKSLIANFHAVAFYAAGKSSESIKSIMDSVRGIIITDVFEEFQADATKAQSDAIDVLKSAFDAAVDCEAESARLQAEREELAAAQAKLKADQSVAAAEQAALRAEIEKNAAIERAAIAEQQRIAKVEQDRIAAEHAQRMAEQQAAMDARQRDMDHAEGLMLNAQFDQLAAARKLEEETSDVAAVEAVAAHVAEAPQQPIATELEWLQYFYQEADFGPADQDVRDIIKCNFMRRHGKQLPEGYSGEE